MPSTRPGAAASAIAISAVTSRVTMRNASLGEGSGALMGALGDQPAAKIHQRRLDTVAVEPHADPVRARRLEPQERRRLAALALVALADDGNEAELLELGDDLADGRVGEVGGTGKICLRRFAEPAQALEHDAMVVAADAGRREPLPRLWRGRHAFPQLFPLRATRCEAGMLINLLVLSK